MAGFSVDDPLDVYLREVRKIPPLTPEEEKDLLEHLRVQDAQAEAAALRLVEANLSFVVLIAQRHPSARVHVLDIFAKG